jgi:hypothetical protein
LAYFVWRHLPDSRVLYWKDGKETQIVGVLLGGGGTATNLRVKAVEFDTGIAGRELSLDLDLVLNEFHFDLLG